MNQIKYFYLTGDLHSDYHPIQNFVRNKLATPLHESAIIVLGDVGANYYCDDRDKYTKYHLNNCGITIYCLRGNHEKRPSTYPNSQYKRVYDENVGGTVLVEEEFPNLRFFLDCGGVYYINGYKILVVPGAYSVDKYYRLEHNWNWFEDEQMNEEEMHDLEEFALYFGQFDYILAHTCPLSWHYAIDDLFLSVVDQSKVDHTTEKFLDNIIEHIYYKRLYFGHYHDDRDLPQEPGTMLYHLFIPFGSKINERPIMWKENDNE